LMVIAIVILMLLTLIGIAITTTASLEMQIASNDRLHKMAFYQADGGIDIGAELLEQNLGCPGGFSATIGTDQRNVGSVRVTDLTLWENTDTDATVPVEFSEILYEQVQAVGLPVELYLYEGDNHNIFANFWTAMQRSIDFFDSQLKN